jgi:hypothetical protein
LTNSGFSKKFCSNPGNVPTNRKRGVKIQKTIMYTYTRSYLKL